MTVAIGVNPDGYREAVGGAEGFTESKGCRAGLPSWSKSHGLRGARIPAGDKATAMMNPIAEAEENPGHHNAQNGTRHD